MQIPTNRYGARLLWPDGLVQSCKNDWNEAKKEKIITLDNTAESEALGRKT